MSQAGSTTLQPFCPDIEKRKYLKLPIRVKTQIALWLAEGRLIPEIVSLVQEKWDIEYSANQLKYNFVHNPRWRQITAEMIKAFEDKIKIVGPRVTSRLHRLRVAEEIVEKNLPVPVGNQPDPRRHKVVLDALEFAAKESGDRQPEAPQGNTFTQYNTYFNMPEEQLASQIRDRQRLLSKLLPEPLVNSPQPVVEPSRPDEAP